MDHMERWEAIIVSQSRLDKGFAAAIVELTDGVTLTGADEDLALVEFDPDGLTASNYLSAMDRLVRLKRFLSST